MILEATFATWWFLVHTQREVPSSYNGPDRDMETLVVARGPFPSRDFCIKAGRIEQPNDEVFLTSKERLTIQARLTDIDNVKKEACLKSPSKSIIAVDSHKCRYSLGCNAKGEVNEDNGSPDWETPRYCPIRYISHSVVAGCTEIK